VIKKKEKREERKEKTKRTKGKKKKRKGKGKIRRQTFGESGEERFREAGTQKLIGYCSLR